MVDGKNELLVNFFSAFRHGDCVSRGSLSELNECDKFSFLLMYQLDIEGIKSSNTIEFFSVCCFLCGQIFHPTKFSIKLLMAGVAFTSCVAFSFDMLQ